jgi:hypothetical protein
MVRPSKTISETNRTASMLITSNQESRASAKHHVALTITGPVLWATRSRTSRAGKYLHLAAARKLLTVLRQNANNEGKKMFSPGEQRQRGLTAFWTS